MMNLISKSLHSIRLNLMPNNLRLNQLASISLVNRQQRTFKRSRENGKKKKEIKVPNSISILNKRYTRTNIARALVNRIYFRFEVYKNKDNAPWLKVTDYLVDRIRARAYKKLHNLVKLSEAYTDKLIHIYSNREASKMTKRAVSFAQLAEIRFVSGNAGKSTDELWQIGIIYDKDGCPKYGKWRNTMFMNIDKNQLVARNFHRLLESKMFTSKFCFDFLPINVSSHSRHSSMFHHLKHIFKRNYLSSVPLNVYFTNYQTNYDPYLKTILYDNSVATNFVDIQSNDKAVLNSKKLIIILKDSFYTRKEIYYDYQADYVLPMYVNNPQINTKIQRRLVLDYGERPNVEFVYVPIEKYIDEESTFNFAYFYFVYDSLKSGLDMKESIQNAFYIYKKQCMIRIDETEDDALKDDLRTTKKIKKFPFKQFDSLEDDLL